MPSPTIDRALMTFAEIVPVLLAGKPVRRHSWPGDDVILLYAGVLHLRNAAGLHRLIVSEGDLSATDWVEVEG